MKEPDGKYAARRAYGMPPRECAAATIDARSYQTKVLNSHHGLRRKRFHQLSNDRRSISICEKWLSSSLRTRCRLGGVQPHPPRTMYTQGVPDAQSRQDFARDNKRHRGRIGFNRNSGRRQPTSVITHDKRKTSANRR